MANSDEEDAFLYSSEDEVEKKQQPVKKKVKFADDVKVTDGKNESIKIEPQEEDDNNNDDDDEEEDEDEESDSDDDIDIIIGDNQPTKSSSASSSTTLGNDTLSEVVDEESATATKKPQHTTVTSRIDIDNVPEYEDKPLTQLDLDLLKLKPWRAPGVDVSDYFNFGFDEFTWTAYCHKQDKLRGEFNPQKVMESIMKGTGATDNKMPPPPPGMAVPPPSFMQGIPPGMPPMTGMPPGMPPNFANMPIPPQFNGQFPQPYNMTPNPNQK
ncbi:FIP1 Pre-mRNA polyadenylation factor FIP1 [Candida maltosa Xu316]|uniref:Pre-mRNA polyadenylation factor FIP1 n=1 Tax=Candida maltosa (strain Xu316) TaxID=1245528 RepID=M3JZT0_CANMX|nr:hypothetical protein G210_1589 [Candida maltosa Xu316]